MLPTLIKKERDLWAGGCIYNSKGEILIVRKKDSDKWGLPGGKPKEEKEENEATARREINEETGLNPTSFKMISDTEFKKEKYLGLEKTMQRVIVYLCKVDSFEGLSAQGEELDETKIISIQELFEGGSGIKISKKFQPALREARKLIEQEIQREGMEGGWGQRR